MLNRGWTFRQASSVSKSVVSKLVAGAAVVISVLASGCASPPTSSQQANDTIGPSAGRGDRVARRMPLVGVTHGPLVSWSTQGGALVRVDPARFRPLPGRRIDLGIHGYSWSYSPDRSKLVLGGFASGLRFVDVRAFRHVGDLRENQRGGLVLAIAWPTRRRVLAVVQEPWGGGPLTLAIVDPDERTVVAWRPVSGPVTVVKTVANRLGLFLLVGPSRGIGPTELLFIDARGTARRVALARIRAGQVAGHPSPTGRVIRWWVPDLTVDLAGRRAFVVGGGAPVAEVDLRSMAVAYHDLRQPVSLLGRLRNWLEPVAQAKGETEGPVRYASWLGDGLLAVSGYDARGRAPSAARGLKLIDTNTWAVRTLDQKSGDFVSTQRLLLAYGCRCRERGDESLGLAAYDEGGHQRWHLLLGGKPVGAVQVHPSRAYARLDVEWLPRGPLVAVVDLRSGKVVRTVRRPWTQLLLPQESSMAEKEG
jgi:hypothetical protein